MKKQLLLFLILLLALALRVPGWFTADAKMPFQLFEPDEYQHAEVAIWLMKHWDPSLYPEWDRESGIYNARGFGIQMGVLSFLWNRVSGHSPSVEQLIMLGRVMSTMYAIALIALVYLITLHLFHSRVAAQLAALLMALFDLNVTYSHYAVPEVAHVFWAYAAVFLIIRFYEHYLLKKPAGDPSWGLCVGIPLAAAGSFAIRFDFVPIAVAALVLLVLHVRKKMKLRPLIGYASSFVAFFLIGHFIVTAFSFGWARVQDALTTLFEVNSNVLASDYHWLTNPLVYVSAATAGTSLLVAIVFAVALVALLGRGKAFPGQPALRWWLFFILLEFLVLWKLDIPFVRRASVFLPFIAIVAGRGLAGVWRGDPQRPLWQRNGATLLVLVYTLVLTLVSQSQTWLDTREAARDYLAEHHPQAKIHYSPYAWAPGMPAQDTTWEAAELLVLHETFYSRYWKSLTTPFKYPPKCCDEVYHCRSEEECRQYQELLSGAASGYQLVKKFPTREWLPERKLYKELFGTYETFLGDVLIYARKKE